MFLSFIVPVYNTEQYLLECLDSLLLQDLPLTDYEIICIDDGSTDHSADILRKYCEAKRTNIKVITQQNAGVSASRNQGLNNAKGDYVWFVDVFCKENLPKQKIENDNNAEKIEKYSNVELTMLKMINDRICKVKLIICADSELITDRQNYSAGPFLFQVIRTYLRMKLNCQTICCFSEQPSVVSAVKWVVSMAIMTNIVLKFFAVCKQRIQSAEYFHPHINLTRMLHIIGEQVAQRYYFQILIFQLINQTRNQFPVQFFL